MLGYGIVLQEEESIFLKCKSILFESEVVEGVESCYG